MDNSLQAIKEHGLVLLQAGVTLEWYDFTIIPINGMIQVSGGFMKRELSQAGLERCIQEIIDELRENGQFADQTINPWMGNEVSQSVGR